MVVDLCTFMDCRSELSMVILCGTDGDLMFASFVFCVLNFEGNTIALLPGPHNLKI